MSNEATSKNAYREKLLSLSFNSRPVLSKQTVDHTDTAVVYTTEKAESQDVRVCINDAVRPHWKEPKDA